MRFAFSHPPQTPTLTHAEGRQADDYSWTLVVNGTGFAKQATRNSAWVADVPCVISSGDDSHLICTTVALPSGDLAVRVRHDEHGFAEGHVEVSVALRVDGVSPSIFPVLGGVIVDILGSGFSSDFEANAVTLCGRPCRVLNWTTDQSPNTLKCMTSSMIPTPATGLRTLTAVVDSGAADVEAVSGDGGSFSGSNPTVSVSSASSALLRFAKVALPRGSVASRTVLRVTPYGGSGRVRLVIELKLVGCGEGASSTIPSTSRGLSYVTPEGYSAGTILWEPSDWTDSKTTFNTVESPDLSPLLNNLINLRAWRFDEWGSAAAFGGCSIDVKITLRAWERSDPAAAGLPASLFSSGHRSFYTADQATGTVGVSLAAQLLVSFRSPDPVTQLTMFAADEADAVGGSPPLAPPPPATPPPPSPPPSPPYSHLEYVSTSATFEAALVDCQSRGGTLAAPMTSVLLTELRTFLSYNSISASFWIGLSDREFEGTWRWEATTMRPVMTYSNWNYGEPNNVGNEVSCLRMFTTTQLACHLSSYLFVF